MLAGSLAVLECDKVAVYEAGDHVILVGQVRRLHCEAEGEPLLYFRGRYPQSRQPRVVLFPLACKHPSPSRYAGPSPLPQAGEGRRSEYR